MKKFKLTLISFSFVRGGAAIAANNFFDLAKSFSGFEVNRISQDEAGFFQFLKRVISWLLGKFERYGNPTKHSLNLFSYSKLVRSFKQNPDHLYHLHWINNDTLSIWDFDKIPAYSLITLHDEWFYCGTEHYYEVGAEYQEFISGYSKEGLQNGLPWSYWVWKIKARQLRDRADLHFSVPSKWMLERAKSSFILKDKSIHYLPNCIDTDLFSPLDLEAKKKARKEFGISEKEFVIGFGAIDGSKNPLKGSKILTEALALWLLEKPTEIKERIVLLGFGGEMTTEFFNLGVSYRTTGFLKDRSQLAKIYGISNVVLVPSIVESFGQVAGEAMACGSPVICFETSGLMDIVIHEKTGWVASSFSTRSFAEKLDLAFSLSSEKSEFMAKNARKHILENFSIPQIQIKYKKVLDEMLELKEQDRVS